MDNEEGLAIRITKEEQHIIDSAISKMDLTLSSGQTTKLANRINTLYALAVSSMNAFLKICHASNIDNKEAIQGISVGMQKAIYEFITTPEFAEGKDSPIDDSANVKEEDVTLDVSSEGADSSKEETEESNEPNNIVSLDAFKKRKS